MPDAVVESKLLLPRARAQTLSRPRLDDLLVRGWDSTLLLVSAPAGFGKTTLLGTWLAAGGLDRPTAWVSLDGRDRDASLFWTYILLAVDRAAPGTATAALAQLQSGPAPIETVLTTLLNELSVQPHDLNLVVDDYHLAEGPELQTGMAFLVDHLPPQVHLVISSRADAALPLARLRARGQLVEIRAADLRFTGEEAAAHLNDLNTLGLEPDEVAALKGRTEGWAAALQLAAQEHGRLCRRSGPRARWRRRLTWAAVHGKDGSQRTPSVAAALSARTRSASFIASNPARVRSSTVPMTGLPQMMSTRSA